MKKFFFSLATMLTSILLTVSAQSDIKRSIPRPQAPGVEFSVQDKAVSIAKSKKPLKKADVKTAERIAIATVENDVAGYTPYDTVLLTKYSCKLDGEEIINSTYTYDEYGHRQLIKTVGTSGNYETRYTYTIGEFNFWTSKLVETKSPYSDEWFFESKEYREIDSFKRLTLRKTYGITEGTGKPYLDREEHFDYAHPYYDEMANLTYGHRVKDIYYNSDGSIYNSEEYSWFAPAGKYILKATLTGYSKRESTFGNDYVVYKIYSGNESEGYTLDTEEEIYYGNKIGQFVKYYSNNEISYCYGEYYEFQKNTPSAGYTTSTYYTYDEYEQKWVPVNRTVSSGMKYEDGGFQEQFKVDYYIKNENYYEGEWQLENEVRGEWLSNNILKRTTSYDGENKTVYYTKYDADGNNVGSVTYNADNSYVLTTTTIVNGDISVQYVYYSATGEEQKTIVRKKTTIGANQSEEDICYYLKEGDKLTPLSNYETTTKAYGQTLKTSYTFTKEGWPLTISMDVSMSEGQPFLKYSKTVYEYNDKGYKVSEYDYAYMNSFNETPTELLSTMTEYVLLEDGTYRCTSYEYDEDDGSVSYANRTECTKDLIQISYSYNADSKTFEVSDKYCLPIETVAADGTITCIERYLDDDGNPVNRSKREELRQNNERMEAYYEWDVENSKWVGSYKSYQRDEETVNFNYTIAADPCSMYDDEYLVSNSSEHRYDRAYSTYINYEWDYEAGNWYVVHGYEYDFDINGNTLSLTKTETDREYKTVTKYLVVGNDNGFVEKEEMNRTVENNETGEKEEYSLVTTYKFNSYGLMSEYNTIRKESDGTTTTELCTYEYTACKVYPTDIKNVEQDEIGLAISGLDITSADGSYIELYTIDGAKVAGAYDAITAPAEGKYIVKCNGKAAVVVVKQ